MKKLFIFLILFSVISCKTNNYKYKVKGKIYIPTSGVNPMDDAVWYTNNYNIVNDTLIYRNSDGSEVRVNPPFKVYRMY